MIDYLSHLKEKRHFVGYIQFLYKTHQTMYAELILRR